MLKTAQFLAACPALSCLCRRDADAQRYHPTDDYSEVVSTELVPTGKSTVRMDFVYDGAAGETGKGGNVTLSANGQVIGRGQLHKTVPGRFGIDTFGIGEDTGVPVADSYDPPFAFTGRIDQVLIDLE